eukprot:3920403-Heterocapsa_arctica.AAC.1
MINTVALPDASPALIHALLHRFQPLDLFHTIEPEDVEGRHAMERLGATAAARGFQAEELGVFQACFKTIQNDGARGPNDYCIMCILGEYPPIYA